MANGKSHYDVSLTGDVSIGTRPPKPKPQPTPKHIAFGGEVAFWLLFIAAVVQGIFLLTGRFSPEDLLEQVILEGVFVGGTVLMIVAIKGTRPPKEQDPDEPDTPKKPIN